MAIKYFVEAGALAVRRVKKEDMRRIAKLTGATMMITLADMEGNESFSPDMLGVADEVCHAAPLPARRQQRASPRLFFAPPAADGSPALSALR